MLSRHAHILLHAKIDKRLLMDKCSARRESDWLAAKLISTPVSSVNDSLRV